MSRTLDGSQPDWNSVAPIPAPGGAPNVLLVMTDDEAVRANRLALLRGIAQTMNRVADISKLAA